MSCSTWLSSILPPLKFDCHGQDSTRAPFLCICNFYLKMAVTNSVSGISLLILSWNLLRRSSCACVGVSVASLESNLLFELCIIMTCSSSPRLLLEVVFEGTLCFYPSPFKSSTRDLACMEGPSHCTVRIAFLFNRQPAEDSGHFISEKHVLVQIWHCIEGLSTFTPLYRWQDMQGNGLA